MDCGVYRWKKCHTLEDGILSAVVAAAPYHRIALKRPVFYLQKGIKLSYKTLACSFSHTCVHA